MQGSIISNSNKFPDFFYSFIGFHAIHIRFDSRLKYRFTGYRNFILLKPVQNFNAKTLEMERKRTGSRLPEMSDQVER